jgi:hypothetical protein
MTFKPVTDRAFLKTIEHWLRSQPEILVLIRYSRAAGNKSFEFFSSYVELENRLHQLGPETCVTAFRLPQLTLRGVVDDELIDRCLSSIPNGSEFLIVETSRSTAGSASWFHDAAGESHDELREALEDSRGRPVAVGAYPQDDGPDVISAYVPNRDGTVRRGVY